MRSYSQVYIMMVFGVKYRLGLIEPDWQSKLHSVIGNLVNDLDGVQSLQVGGFKDHVHILISTKGIVSLKEIVRYVKTESSKWVNNNRLTIGRFGWQDGCGKFSYSQSQIAAVKNYISNQEEHHKVISFREEYAGFLKRSGIEITPYLLPEDLV